jgi:DNA-binding CsgD family transcriptional regulator
MQHSASSLPDAQGKDHDLTPFQRRIIALTVAGYSSQECAKRIGISEPALKRHLSRVYSQLRVSNPLELVLFALHCQLVNTRKHH